MTSNLNNWIELSQVHVIVFKMLWNRMKHGCIHLWRWETNGAWHLEFLIKHGVRWPTRSWLHLPHGSSFSIHFILCCKTQASFGTLGRVFFTPKDASCRSGLYTLSDLTQFMHTLLVHVPDVIDRHTEINSFNAQTTEGLNHRYQKLHFRSMCRNPRNSWSTATTAVSHQSISLLARLTESGH